ncbi:PadR family transcriptional regulator [Aneurinibacillus aneurinilyticus]|jgi:PadR family transcriptional regulator PadR|uniref:PadR family transcriptional regulator n=1 Tax=Aneurinibacillus aneurinilyticus TaxID=1391 RepID=A0A848CRQ3_ANEAE|nr:PadR family transcriptional regulator [Aneurinibacillus aneurinilyticus]MCI1696406.1 PadR family transcriptional regulator [Aneurinibacillus aneurinilyticus]MED0669037.1 PadR family transcriptional regulator [Aneurinibacillus aneurinilyticus]NME97858.1 PadR family transcriptional regulator [Aneurinibacillus aneurinilyticus]
MEIAEWNSQVRRGILEYCIMLLVSKEARYGYELVTTLGRWGPLAATEGTLYPLLKRLQKEGYITSFWKESEAGPPRKYYSLTKEGFQLMEKMTAEWSKITEAVYQMQEISYKREKAE